MSVHMLTCGYMENINILLSVVCVACCTVRWLPQLAYVPTLSLDSALWHVLRLQGSYWEIDHSAVPQKIPDTDKVCVCVCIKKVKVHILGTRRYVWG